MRQKLQKYAKNMGTDILLQPQDARYENMKGNWHSNFFHNQNPIVLELACGKGEYTTGLATHFPERNYIGVDIKGDRIQTGIRYAHENNLKNV